MDAVRSSGLSRSENAAIELLGGLIDQATAVLATRFSPPTNRLNAMDQVALEPWSSWQVASRQALVDIFGGDSIYASDFKERVQEQYPSYTEAGRGILTAARSDVSRGRLHVVRVTATLEVFDDLLEMAENLATLRETDASLPLAAFLAGSVLEDALRSIAKRTLSNKSDLDKQDINSLATMLHNRKVIGDDDLKEIRSWNVTRSDADHAHWERVNQTPDRVLSLISGTRRLISEKQRHLA